MQKHRIQRNNITFACSSIIVFLKTRFTLTFKSWFSVNTFCFLITIVFLRRTLINVWKKVKTQLPVRSV
jgi:hypothetical protein